MKPRWRLGLLACGLVLRPSLWTRAMATAGDRAPKRRKGTFASGQTQQFAEVAGALEAYFDGLHRCDVERLKEVWHPEGHLYGIAPSGDVVDRNAETFFDGVAKRKTSEELEEHDRIIRLDFASPRCCAAKVQIALPAAPTSPTPSLTEVLYTDFLILLRLKGRWQIISKVFSAVPLSQLWYTEPYDTLAFAASDPVRGVLEYFRGGHLSRPDILSQNFHEVARLCFSNAEEELVCWSRSDFAEVLRQQPVTAAESEALRFDKILGVDKAGPDVALIKLQIGYPPLLYTDFLSMLRLHGHWWIIAKSSDSESFE
ncbi:unnamed protein product [Cladocopium goreaui]|uniref:SnoaL-like domain-containing protein n=1 Tax=Cladocopium goreaui TaxID=2562237 RepID=A0A9P1DPX1_9DINO|nr:unnamed protein product [Cladocopium goreaui]